MMTHCLGKKAWAHNVADGRSQAERKGADGEKVEMTKQNCEVIMVNLAVEYIGVQEFLEKERAIMIPLKANSDFEKSIDWGVMLAEKLDFGGLDNGKMKRLCKAIDTFLKMNKF